MAKKKSTVKKVPEKGEKHILDMINEEWKEFLINNAYHPRLRHSGAEACEGCHAHKGEFHILPCKFEKCPVCLGISWDCQCPSYTQPDIVCEV